MFPLCLSSTPSFLIYLPPQNYFQSRTLTPSPLCCNLPRNQSLNYTRTLTFFPIHSISSESSASPPLLVEDIIERDWSFLDVDAVNSDDERRRKIHRNISAAAIREGSRVLVCMGSEWFVDRLVESVPSCELLLIIHESLFALAMIKEKYDNVRCWQGEITALPERFSRFDAVFVCYFPGMGVPLDQLLSSVGSRCSPGCFSDFWLQSSDSLLFPIPRLLRFWAVPIPWLSRFPGLCGCWFRFLFLCWFRSLAVVSDSLCCPSAVGLLFY